MKKKEVETRLNAILRGAFKGPPTPRKGIPKRSSESRNEPKKNSSSGANAKNAQPKP